MSSEFIWIYLSVARLAARCEQAGRQVHGISMDVSKWTKWSICYVPDP